MTVPGGGPAAAELAQTWAALLDAVEERTRRVEAFVYGDASELPPELDLPDPGPLPAALAPRAAALLLRTRELEKVVAASRDRARQAFAYHRH